MDFDEIFQTGGGVTEGLNDWSFASVWITVQCGSQSGSRNFLKDICVADCTKSVYSPGGSAALVSVEFCVLPVSVSKC